MSFQASEWVRHLDELPPAQRVVMYVLASYADEAGSCYPGQTRLARETSLSESTVRRALRALEDGGYLRREARRAAGGYRTSDRYHLNVGARPVPAATGRDDRMPSTTGHDDRGESFSPVTDDQSHRSNGPHLTGHSDRVTVREPLEEQPDVSAADAAAQRPEPEPGAQAIVGAWIDACGDTRPPRRVIGHLSKQVRELLDEGQPYADVLAAVQVWHSKGLNPASLPSVLHETRQHGTRPRTGGERAAQAHAALRERTAWTPPATPGLRPPAFPTAPLPLQIEG